MAPIKILLKIKKNIYEFKKNTDWNISLSTLTSCVESLRVASCSCFSNTTHFFWYSLDWECPFFKVSKASFRRATFFLS